MKLVCRLLVFSLPLLSALPGHAAEIRPACALLAQVDLSGTLGKDHDAPVPFGKDSCRAESKAPGRNIFLAVNAQPESEISQWMSSMRKLNAEQRKSEVTVAAEPALGANAFSVQEKGKSPREAEIYAQKGGKSMVLNATFATGTPISAADNDRLRQIAKAILTKLQ